MVRKMINIIAVFILLVTTTGITISKHYCGDLLISVALDGKAKSCCEPGCNCCHNEHVTIHLNDDFVGSQFCLKCYTPGSDFLFVVLPECLPDLPSQNMENQPAATGPPLLTVKTSDRTFMQSFLC